MHFTINLRGSDTYQEDHSYGLVFIPCPVWICGDRQLLNLNPERPDYAAGSVRKLIEREKLASVLGKPLTAVVIVHDVGHGTDNDLKTLVEDLEKEGFQTGVFRSKL